MPFEIVRNDIVNMQVDAIVNTANPRPVIGSGVDAAIHKAAGPELLEARKEIGDLPAGSVKETPAFALPAKYVLHVSGPFWAGGTQGEEKVLRACYRNTLARAADLGCASIAFPLLATGNYRFPQDLALQVAVQEFSAFLPEHDMMVYLVVFGEEAYRLSSSLFSSVQSYIDENYVLEKTEEEYEADVYDRRVYPERPSLNRPEAAAAPAMHEFFAGASYAVDESFSDALIRMIDETGKKRSEIYNRAGVSKQLFSKINGDSDYRPTKPTVIAFAMAMELDLPETAELLGKAGFTLSHSILFDVIVESFLSRGDYDIPKLNCVLLEYDQPLVGNVVA